MIDTQESGLVETDLLIDDGEANDGIPMSSSEKREKKDLGS